MTDFDALIDGYSRSLSDLYLVGDLTKRGELTDKCEQSRSALREAIAEVVRENDGFRKMMKSNTFEDLPKEQLIGIIHSMQDNRAAMFVEHEARVAALEVEYEEAMQFILAVNQPHDYDCANYRNEMKPCDCGYQKLVDTYLSKRGHR